MSQIKKCRRNGCRQKYTQEQNTQGVCGYHPGKPIFHDTKKGWTCCNKVQYDWERFEKIPFCTFGKHSDVKVVDDGPQFYKSNTVKNAENAIKKQEKKIVIKDINQYNKEIQQKKKKQEAEAPKVEKKLFKTKKGNLKCINQGCGKQFTEQQNTEQSCSYHKGAPIFHDLQKMWTCCGLKTFDWDQFTKFPKCCTGYHSPKYV